MEAPDRNKFVAGCSDLAAKTWSWKDELRHGRGF